MNILCELRLCCYPKNNMCNSGSERMQQYINGLNRFFELNENNKSINNAMKKFVLFIL